MATELVARPVGLTDTRTIEDLKWMQHQVHKLLEEVLKEGIDNDYAVIPGTKKLTLLKPGAEKIINLFRFVPTLRVEEYRDGEDVTFRVFVSLSAASGNLLGEGIGQASTKESKFAWRKAVCTEEYEATEPSKRRIKWSANYQSGEAETTLQVRENPADKENNMLKIAKKRALIDAVLTVTGCSNLFTQDREEDIPDNPDGAPSKAPAKKTAPMPAKDQGPVISQAQSGRFYGIWKNANRTTADVKLYLERVCGVDDSRKMPSKFYEEACRWAATSEPVPAAKAQEQAPAAQTNSAETEARAAFDVLGWNEGAQKRFIEQYASDWAKILGEVKVLVAKRNDKF